MPCRSVVKMKTTTMSEDDAVQDIIVKVQISLAPTGGMALIYNEDRSVMGEFPATRFLLNVMRGRKKAYFRADLTPEGLVQLGDRVKDQPW